MRSPRLGLVAALEAEQELEAALDIGLGNNATGVETAMLDIGELEAEFTSAEVDNSNIVEVTEALESIAIALEASGQSLNKSGAQILNITLNSLYGTVGIVNKQSSIATESLDNKNCFDYSKVALEGISDGIKKIWEAIIAAIKKSIQWVKDFISKLFGINKKIEERIEKVEDAIKMKEKEGNNSSGSPISKDWPGDFDSSKKQGSLGSDVKESKPSNIFEFENVHIFKHLQINGKFPSNIVSEMDNYDKLSIDILVKAEDVLFNVFNKALDNLDLDTDDIDKALFFPKVDFGSILRPVKDGYIAEGMVRLASEKSFGDVSLFIDVPANQCTGAKAAKSIKEAKIWVDSPLDSKGPPTKIPVLNIDQNIELIKKLKKVVVLINAQDKELEKIIKYKEKATKTIEDAYQGYKRSKNSAEYSESNNYKESNAKLIREFIMKSVHLIDGINIKYLIYAKNVNAALLQYIEASVIKI